MPYIFFKRSPTVQIQAILPDKWDVIFTPTNNLYSDPTKPPTPNGGPRPVSPVSLDATSVFLGFFRIATSPTTRQPSHYRC